jgi:hypothetical protein
MPLIGAPVPYGSLLQMWCILNKVNDNGHPSCTPWLMGVDTDNVELNTILILMSLYIFIVTCNILFDVFLYTAPKIVCP